MSAPNAPGLAGHQQEQFLQVLSRDDAEAAFMAALGPRPLGAEEVALEALLGRVLARDIAAPVDAPPFDRAVVDGFALRAADLFEASEAEPVRLRLNPEVIHCGTAPALPVAPGTATPIATGGPIPRGADAVVMIEHTEPEGDGIAVARAVAPGSFIGFAGSDIARGQTLLRRGVVIGAREVAMLAAVGLDRAPVWRKPRVAVLSTGDELVRPGDPLRPAGVYDSNGPVIAAALAENGCEAVHLGAIPDDEAQLTEAVRAAFAAHDALILSGGTSKGAGDLTTRVIAGLGAPGIVAHGVALKPGKPLCLAVCDGKPVAVLPGFPTSAMFTLHEMVAPVLRIMAGLPPRGAARIEAVLPLRLGSELGRTEFAMVALTEGPEGAVAHPVGKGSGAVTAFAQADGFLTVPALVDSLAAGTRAEVTLFGVGVAAPRLAVIGSHCVGLDAVVGRLAGQGMTARILATGSQGGLAALARRECDIAPIHLFDPATDSFNTPYLADGMRLIPGWRRMQGLVFRAGDARLAGKGVAEALAALLADPEAIMVNRNQGAGTRVLIDRLLAGARPQGYWNQPNSHNAVAAAVAQGRADWGVAIRPAAEALGLGFLPVAEEHYDFAVWQDPRDAAALEAFEAALAQSRDELHALGFDPR
ncbi:molybdopterin biosynthesis protein [Roseicyclus persicicus]|uniref:Molybdopterin molybdenumtransferase n=1 Tax=Roseicyclus persicicus TaxID=2650661 RepID=A0A7X6GZL1_9RHOB|nr:molybdopterin biosynthesis protein [Roseibacterium persicicum]NKX44483.1 molybdopterin biosynthesis protein [Roseibacterium persicicum]